MSDASRSAEPSGEPASVAPNGRRNGKISLQRKIDKAREYQASALGNPNLLVGNLELAAGGMMEIAFRIQDVVTSELESGPASLEKIQRLMPALETCLKLTRQVDRIAQISQLARIPIENTLESHSAVRRLAARRDSPSEDLQE